MMTAGTLPRHKSTPWFRPPEVGSNEGTSSAQRDLWHFATQSSLKLLIDINTRRIACDAIFMRGRTRYRSIVLIRLQDRKNEGCSAAANNKNEVMKDRAIWKFEMASEVTIPWAHGETENERMPSMRGWRNRLEATMLREELFHHHVSDDHEKLPYDHGRTTKSVAVLERQNAELRACNDLLEEEIRRLRKAFAPRLLFPLSWHLNRGETSVLACLYVSPDGFRSTAMLSTCAETFSADSDGAKVVSARIFNLRNKLRPFGIRLITRHGEGYLLPPDSRVIIETALKKENA
jgi:hypothetical protein